MWVFSYCELCFRSSSLAVVDHMSASFTLRSDMFLVLQITEEYDRIIVVFALNCKLNQVIRVIGSYFVGKIMLHGHKGGFDSLLCFCVASLRFHYSLKPVWPL